MHFLECSERCSNVGTVCMAVFIFSSYFPLTEKLIISEHWCSSWLQEFNDQFSWALILLFLYEARFLRSGEHKQLLVVTSNAFVTKGEQKHSIFPPEIQCGHLENKSASRYNSGFRYRWHNSTYSTWGSPVKPSDQAKPTPQFYSLNFF